MARLTDPALLDALARMRTILQSRRGENIQSEKYYTGKIAVRNLKIAIPVELENLGVVSDWPTTVVNSYHERMVFLGWRDGGRYGMRELAAVTNAQIAIWESILDSLVFGVGFTAIDLDYDGIWKAQAVAPTEGTLLWDAHSHRPTHGYRLRTLTDGTTQEVLYAPYYTYYLKSGPGLSPAQHPEVVDVVPTGLPCPAVDRVRNQLRSSQWYGRSLLTPAVRYYTQAAARTLMGMEYNREFYTTPKWHIKNATMDMFTDSDNPSPTEKARAGWDATTGSVLTLPPPEDGEPEMDIGQFAANPPTPYVEQLRTYSQLMGSATGIPTSYLGFSTENPPSADAIRAWLERLVRGCSSQQRLISPDVRHLGWMLHFLNQERTPWSEFATSTRELWENPATPTLSSDADAVTKLTAENIVPAQSDWVYDRLGITEEEREDFRSSSRTSALSMIAQRAQQAAQIPADTSTAAQLADLRGETP